MTDQTITVDLTYQSGVFVPTPDVSHLAEGSRFALNVPAPADEWDLLLEQIVLQSDVAYAGFELLPPDCAHTRWSAVTGDAERFLAGCEDLLTWNQRGLLAPNTPLL